jgi:putative ABC transport system substrate-binding protein
MGDPVGDGLVHSLARPGGNVTGLTFLGPRLVAKRLGLLKEALPTISRVAVLWHPGAYSEATVDAMTHETKEAANSLGLSLKFVSVLRPDDFESAFAAIDTDHPGALFEFPSPMFFAERSRIVSLGAKYQLPTMSISKEFVTLGGLMSYGANVTDLFRLSAIYVDKILKGARPADLPVEQPTKFELCVNLKTAKELGIEIPAALLAQADEVIE